MSIRLGVLFLSIGAIAGCGNKSALLNCPPPLVACSAQCIDLDSDALNCGACGTACGNATTCVKGVCSGQCASQLTMCDGACVDPRSDHAHCGGCKTACHQDEVCSGGNCAVSCGEGLTGCAGACLDLSKDKANCGVCGHACSLGSDCISGACTAFCGPPLSSCGDKCIDQRFDPDHCGACDMICPGGANIVRYCMSGICGSTGCEPGFFDCNGQIADGCEVDTRSDIMHCGNCYNSCPQAPHAATICAKAMCSVGACDKGFEDCDKDPGNGCESELASDINNCSACGQPCAQPPHVVASCTLGKCTLGGCEPGWTDCNGDMKDGCEANLTSDPQNCGMCGMVCPMNLPYCGSGTCNLQPTLVGSFDVSDGPNWGDNPPCYTCLEACAIVFGGLATDYHCSTDMNTITKTAWESGYADGGHCDNDPFPEDFKMNDHYDCGMFGCSYSAYVSDNCGNSINYCWK